MMHLKLNSKIKRLPSYVALGLLVILALFPIYWMIISAFKTTSEIYSLTPSFLPKSLNWSGFTYLFEKTSFITNLLNTIFIALLVSTISVVVGAMAAYAIARIDFKGRATISRSMFYAYIMPKTLLFIPVYVMITKLGLQNNIRGLIFIYPTLTIPYAAWMLSSYFKTIPYEIEEAGIVDGCSPVGCLVRLIIPLSMPGLISVFVFCISICWSEYLYAMIVVTKKSQMTISICLSNLIVGDVIKWGPISAGAIISTIPIILIYALGSDKMAGGATAGGVKG